ncbi:hypothetical protein J0895_13500 [Phormidium pseudopriestleyi FRX01]|uniref:Acyl carrier protein n=1 Tax=Phormidium pseudopriestleyi FRX01 TaxID=1759528 RepID=A0ABS3FSY7_9CYAN|nr:hypothetical protein [Phormidium pseudopriestleyi]MBO0350109.1 hypothetical protein [Phormidium pseudopriestleyi FRX01]
MLRQIKHIFWTVRTYSDLSPDLYIRKQVNQTLCERANLSLDEWFHCFWRSREISFSVVSFVYIQLKKYSGLQMGRVLPGDRLEQDLQLTLISWFDWNLYLCDDFFEEFGINIGDRFDLQTMGTVEDLVLYLHRLSRPPS